MPIPDMCNECDKISKVLDWRGLCDSCAEKEDLKEGERDVQKRNQNKSSIKEKSFKENS